MPEDTSVHSPAPSGPAHTAGDQPPPESALALPDPVPSTAEPPLIGLTRLQPVVVTSVWPTEAHHFTPWLLQNAELLSEVLGVDVELESREYKVGKFSLDIIGRELETGAPV